MNAADTVTSLAFAPLVRVAESRDANDVARAIRALVSASPSLEEHAPVDDWFSSWEELELAAPDAAIAIEAAATTSLADLEVFGFLAKTAASLSDAFARAGALRALWARGTRWELFDDEAAGTVRIALVSWPGHTRRGHELAHEFLIAEMVHSVREMVGESITPTLVSFVHAAPASEDAYTLFFGGPVRFGHAESAVSFSRAVGALPLRAFDSALHAWFLRRCEELARQTSSEDPWLGEVRGWLASEYARQAPTAKGLARAMAMSDRTLRRRLADVGTTFRELQERVAVDLANAYLARPGLTASEVAFLLGFSEPSAFFRAYRKWTGETPRSFQQRARAPRLR